MKYGNKANARKVDAPAMSSEASVANNFLRGVISTDSLTKNYRSVQRCNNLLSESMLTNSQSGVNHSYFTTAVGQRDFSEKIINQIFTSEGSCFFNQSFNAASMRVCQPRPVDLKASITSGEYRTDVSFFTGLADIGLPRRMILLPLLSVAVAKKSSSSSGASSGSIQVFFESFNFAFISFPHRDNATRFIALRPDHNNKPRVQFTYGDLPRFSIVLPIIFTGKMKPCKDLSSSGEIKPALKQGTISFVLVIFNFHNFIVATINGKSNVDPKIFSLYTVLAVAKSTAGICTPFIVKALNRASGFFMGEAQLHLLFVVIMVGRAGEPQGSPGSFATGSANPVRLTTHEICTSSGELSNLSQKDAIMATIPTQTQPKTPNIYVSDIDLERRTHEINLLLGCASFLACNATQEAKRCLVDILVIIERLTQELISLTQDAKYRANTPPATSRRRGRI